MVLTYEDYLDFCESQGYAQPMSEEDWQQEKDEARAERLIQNKEIDDAD